LCFNFCHLAKSRAAEQASIESLRYCRDDLGNHVDQIQNDLDGLKELLQGDNYSIDANTLLSVCNWMGSLFQISLSSCFLQLFADDPMSLNMGLPAQEKDLGNELISYNSSLFDLADDNNDSMEDSAAALFPDSDLTAEQPSMESIVSYQSNICLSLN
jgi:hypothetical protein